MKKYLAFGLLVFIVSVAVTSAGGFYQKWGNNGYSDYPKKMYEIYPREEYSRYDRWNNGRDSYRNPRYDHWNNENWGKSRKDHWNNGNWQNSQYDHWRNNRPTTTYGWGRK